jgi:hypothetical protein
MGTVCSSCLSGSEIVLPSGQPSVATVILSLFLADSDFVI